MGAIVTLKDYNSIVERINTFSCFGFELETCLITEYVLPLLTTRSIIAQIFKRQMRYTHFRVKDQAADVWYRYQIALHNGEPHGIIIRLSNELSSSPSLVAKIVLEQFFRAKMKPKRSAADLSLSPEKTTNPDYSDLSELEQKTGVSVGTMLRDTTLIPDGRLAYEILLCTLSDTKYGHITELGNRLVGEEYECRLAREALNSGLSFQSERDLRAERFDKTPDLKLNVPIAIDGFVVNWIESKALFGSPEEHESYTKDQYSCYWNRFGSGLVIYWFGYVDSISVPEEKRFIVRAELPSNIRHMKPLAIPLERRNELLFSS